MTLGQATGGRPAPVAARPPAPRSLGLGLGLGANQRRNFLQAAQQGQGAQFAGQHLAGRLQGLGQPQQQRIQNFIGSGGQLQGRAYARAGRPLQQPASMPAPPPPQSQMPMPPPPQGNPSMGMVGGNMNQPPQNPYGVNPGMQSVINSRMQQGVNAGGYGFQPNYGRPGVSYEQGPILAQNMQSGGYGYGGPNGSYLTGYGFGGGTMGGAMGNFGSIAGGWGGAGSGGGGFNPGDPLANYNWGSAQPTGYGSGGGGSQTALQRQAGQNLYGTM